MLKKLLSLLLGTTNKPKPAYAYVPKQQPKRMPQKRSN